MVQFLLGTMTGGVVGVVAMCLFTVAGQSDMQDNDFPEHFDEL